MAEPDSDGVLAQFNQLIEELLEGNLHRSTFRPWEVVILVDMVRCNPSGSILRKYRNAVQQHMLAGARAQLKLSEYMESLHVRGNQRKRAAKQRATGPHGN